jgi:hypothetical protein
MAQQENEDLSPISRCPPNQRSGLKLTPPFFVSCGCWDDLFIPVGFVASTIRSVLNKGLKEAAEKVLGKTLLKNRLGKLAAKKAAANKAYDVLESAWKSIAEKWNKLSDQLNEEVSARLAKINKIRILESQNGLSSLRETIKWWQDQIKYIQDSFPRWKSKILELQQQYPGETYYPGWNLSRSQYFKQYGQDFPSYAIQRQKAVNDYYVLINNYARAKSDIEMFKKAIADNIKKLEDLERSYGRSIKEEVRLLKEGIKEHIRAEKIIQAQIDFPNRRPIVLGPGRTVPQGSYQQQIDHLTAQARELNEHMGAIERLEDRAATAVDARIEKLNQDIDALFPDIGLTMVEVIVDILSTFTLVGPHLCREGSDGVTLNLENCKCDTCPPDKELCQPLSFDPGIRLPWTAIADSANYCLDPCCEGKVDSEGRPLRIYKPSTYVFNGGIGELLGVEQCSCDCPTDALGQPRIKRPCLTSECNDGYACASESFPDDDCTTLRIFSKFYWYDGSDSSKPWCGFRCKQELSDADCFSRYGEFTQWDSRNAFCSCICKEKSETNCPEKATYSVVDNYNLPQDFVGTSCDLLENPIEPVCTCVCDRPDDCPPGQVLNRSITGPNACECVADDSSSGYGLSFIPPKTYYFDKESQSWKISN